ncbi:MAG: LytR C-terminal domain-containing protein [Ilumatobacter sp.]
MSRTTALNVILGVLATGLVAIAIFLRTAPDPVAAPPTSVATTVPTTSTSTTTSTTTTTTSTTTTTTTTLPVATTVEPPGERGFTEVLVVNGTAAGERLAPTIERLEALGYTEVRGVVGAAQASKTTIYFVDGAVGLAQRVATDLGYELGFIPIEPIEDAPPVAGVGTAFVIVYLGPGELPPPPSTTEPGEGEPETADG